MAEQAPNRPKDLAIRPAIRLFRRAVLVNERPLPTLPDCHEDGPLARRSGAQAGIVVRGIATLATARD